ncbi:hypothetical protein MLD38_014278 [Melastoma candidum]|uniref:Uncharacterized protein n=1 Tax=Melastoma candidum TaxID=119954 RepID=A0ACB9RBW2_9MYRT|nr:hypothetical protein MLD38_014278 [Melastoma candidum]
MVLPKEEDDDEVVEFLQTCSSTLLHGLPSPSMMVLNEDADGGGGGGGEKGTISAVVEDSRNGSPSSSSTTGSVGLPKPMEGLNEAGPPPFLRKAYEMVDDPRTDSLVSWSGGGSSFVVWDQHEFSKHLLPKYFKHRNFSSFIRQLNTYGFKKIDPDRWEFGNEGFQWGKRHLLKTIKRRSRNNKHGRGSASVKDKGTMLHELNDLEVLQKDQDALREDIVQLRCQEENSRSAISAMEERIRCTELRQHNMFMFLAKAVKSPVYMEKLLEKRKQREAELGLGDTVTNKRKLSGIASPEANPAPIRITNQAFRNDMITRDLALESTREPAPEPSGAICGQNGQKKPEQLSEDPVSQSLYGYDSISGGREQPRKKAWEVRRRSELMQLNLLGAGKPDGQTFWMGNHTWE